MGAPRRRFARATAAAGRSALLPAATVAAAAGVLIYAQFGDVPPLAAFLTIAALLAGALRASQLHRQATRAVQAAHAAYAVDRLTGLPNRHALLVDIDAAIASGEPRTLVVFDLEGFKQYNDCFGRAAGDGLLRRLIFGFANLVSAHGRAYRLAGDEFCAILDHEASAGDPVIEAAAAMLVDDTGLFHVTSSYGFVPLAGGVANATEALKLADHQLYATKQAREGVGMAQARDVLLTVLEFRDPDLVRHMQDVAEMAREVGRRMGLDGEEIDILGRAAELHDVGKVAVPEAILAKTGPLDDDEWAFVRRHTLIGERIVGATPPLRPVASLVRASHERWDGTGYPDAIAGEEIPLGARIIAACDAFDAMISDRAYRPARSVHAALDELERNAGTQFDPQVIRTLVDYARERARVAGPGFEPGKA